VIRKSGAWYIYNGEQLGQGKEKARLALCEQPGLADEIDLAVRAKGGAGMSVSSGSVEPDEDDPLADSQT